MTTSASSSQQPTPAGGRQTIVTYSSYSEAERAVDWLSDQGFPVERVAIVGTGLRLVEQVAGRVTTGRAAATGAGQGAMLGLLFGLLFGIFFTISAGSFLGVVLYGLILGAVFGAVLGAISHAAQGGRRDFASAASMQAERYEVLADPDVAGEARDLIGRVPTGRD